MQRPKPKKKAISIQGWLGDILKKKEMCLHHILCVFEYKISSFANVFYIVMV
jgi:hypothetical protein